MEWDVAEKRPSNFVLISISQPNTTVIGLEVINATNPNPKLATQF